MPGQKEIGEEGGCYMEIKQWNGSQNDLMRIIQESVPGKQITMAHIISSPDPVIYKNWVWTRESITRRRLSAC